MTTKERIFEVATELFAKEGYNIVSMRDIAKKVGITEGAIYRHYENKEAILDDIFDTYTRTHVNFLISKKQVDAYFETHTPKQLLEHFVQAHNEDAQGFISNTLRILYRESITNLKAKDIIDNQAYNYLIEFIKYVLDSLIEHGSIPETDTATLSLVWTQAMMFTAHKWASCWYDEESIRKVTEDYLAMSEWMIETVLSGGKIPTE